MVTHRAGLPLNMRFNRPQNVEIAEYYYTWCYFDLGQGKGKNSFFSIRLLSI